MSPEGVFSCPDRTGLKWQLINRLWLTQTRHGMQSKPAAAEASVTLQQPEAHPVHSPGEVVPGSREPGSGGLHRLPGGVLCIVTGAGTQAFWWPQQQP